METLKMLQARKAIRHYTGQVTDQQLQKILRAGSAAPVGLGEYDNYRLTVIQDPAILAKMHGIYEAPTVIVISVRESGPMEYVSTGAIAQNLELAAEAQGVGANFNMASLRSVPRDRLPAGFHPAFVMTMGQTSETFRPRSIPANRIATNLVK
ncbi:nitroreductase [Levilactobacillus namurensis DSM 19117]|uniref:Nitroreductase n=1 Tax=Levilactobacillus namurensis DSM 19117 TaxID=1423773 RepID=A0A0R1K0A5_9LACO|nr:nitroreductase family protein [Levilactobacillus namurensis]KRK72775.1 nitroreductase [Levilactobacillus namurensis DSM 19117]GEO74405.1 hypothetical protein LNA02_11030 [Levilactobacillus namurensis]